MKIEVDEIADFLKQRFGIDKKEAIEKDSFEELGLDSLVLYSLVTEIEKKYDIKIDTDDITEINGVSKMCSYINEKLENV